MRVLLVTHDVSRSGAPRVAVLVARSLVDQGHEVRVVARARGPLLSEFAALAPTFVEPWPKVRNKLWSWRPSRLLGYLADTVIAFLVLLRWRPDLVYLNTTAAGIYLRPARRLRRQVLLHVHESGPVAARFLSAARAPGLDGVELVACSPSVRADLAALTHRTAAAITLLPSVPDGPVVRRLSAAPPDLVSYDGADLIVGCCGTVEHRKGADLWAAIAAEVERAVPGRALRFVWLGELATAVDQAGVEFLGPTSNPYPHLRRFDVAALPSRDDPFPLVVLEAMLLGTPVVAFGVGGVADQVGDAGTVVPAGDVAAFAQAVARLLTDDELRTRLGTAARDRAEALYSTRAFAEGLSRVVVEAARRRPAADD